ncbi:MAG: VanZ family protein [Anaerolineales bacterium]
MSIRRLAVVFAIFLGLVIFLADLGYLRFFLWGVSRVKNLDVVLHFLLIGTFSFLAIASLIETFPDRNINWLALGSMFFFFAVFTLEELSQIFIRGRDFSLKDLAANYLGIFVFGFFVWRKYNGRRQSHS